MATWSPARGVWETPVVNLLCGHSEPFSQTWPASGSMRSGRAWERPTSAPRTGAAACSSSPGLPTPRARDWKRGGKDGLEEALLPTPRTSDTNGPGRHGSGGPDLRTAVSLLPTPRASDTGTPGRRASEGFRPPLSQVVLPLLPTPRASDGSKGGPNQRGSSGDLTLPSAAVRLLPTPAASNPNDGEDLANWEARRQRNLAKKTNGNGQGTPLSIAVHKLPTGAPTPPPSPGGSGS